MKSHVSWWIEGVIFIFGAIVAHPVSAQISSDHTLSTVVNHLDNTFQVTGGTQAGKNLFHSFEQFSVPTNSTLSFQNSLDISNIITRVTGQLPSNINGLIKTNGNANLFLINPNGISFGSQAQLDIGGSFVGSTASAIKFADGTYFDAKNPTVPSLLTISVPIGLQFGNNVQGIVNQSLASSVTNSNTTVVGLQVKPDKTLALIGGSVLLDRGNLTAQGGRIELGSVADNSFVGLSPSAKGWALDYSGIQNFQDINISQRSVVDASGAGGTIQMQGKRILLSDGSRVSNFTLGLESTGVLAVKASESVEIIGRPIQGNRSVLISQVQPGGKGRGGQLLIDTKRLIVQDGGAIASTTFGEGAGGGLEINASEVVELTGTGFISPSLLTTSTQGEGAAGDLTINTRRLVVKDGAQIQAATAYEGGGADKGRGGNLTVNASEAVELSGTGKTARDNTIFASGLLASSGIETLPFKPTGGGGDLRINTPVLSIRNGAEISVSGIASGSAGNLEIVAPRIYLDNLGKITANVVTGERGNITLKTENLQLRHQSRISTDAKQNATGGNINIKTNNLIALENSDITANSEQSFGGRVAINAQGIFGTGFRLTQTPSSDITASSALGADFSGSVQIQTPGIDPSKGLVQLAANVVNTSGLIEQRCTANDGNKFVIAGRGGLPPSPNDPLNSESMWIDLGEGAVAHSQQLPVSSQNSVVFEKLTNNKNPIVEAQGWIVGEDGKVILTEQAPQVTAHGFGWQATACPTTAEINRKV